MQVVQLMQTAMVVSKRKKRKAVSSSKDQHGEDVRQELVVGSKRCQEAKEVRGWND
jgi:hypothetical protein